MAHGKRKIKEERGKKGQKEGKKKRKKERKKDRKRKKILSERPPSKHGF